MKSRTITGLKAVVLCAGLWPLAGLVRGAWQTYQGTGDGLGVNPVEMVTHTTGHFALYLLLVTLCVTPLRRLTGLGWLVRFRRLLGILAFTYATLHLCTYIFDRAYVELSFDLRGIVKDIAKRPYITVGFIAYLFLVPLAVTSTNAMIRRLGKRWQALHRLVYVCTTLGVIHFIWLVKADLRRPLLCAGALLALMLIRVGLWLRGTRRRGSPSVES